MIDFSNLPKRNKAYAGANGSKISVMYNGEQYMLKFPPTPTKNANISYTNSCLSEYIGCQIFASVGIPVQETLLGTYTIGDKEKVVVGCLTAIRLYTDAKSGPVGHFFYMLIIFLDNSKRKRKRFQCPFRTWRRALRRLFFCFYFIKKLCVGNVSIRIATKRHHKFMP